MPTTDESGSQHAPLSASVRALTTRIAQGDRDAFATFYRTWFDWTYAEARRVTRRDESFCLDVVQDAMLRVIRSLRPLESQGQLTAFLKTIVRACAYDRMRKELRRGRREGAVEPVEAIEGHDVALKERLEWLQRELASMDEPSARLLVLRYRMGWTLERIGSALGLKTGAVDGRIGRVLGRLRNRAGETGDDGTG